MRGLQGSIQVICVYVIRYLKNAGQSKYGTIILGLATQFLLGQDQYLKALVSATNALSNHKFDAMYYDVKKKHKDKSHQKDKLHKPSKKKDSS